MGVARVSSTSACLAVPSLSKPAPNTIISDSFSVTSVQPDVDAQQADREKDMYDPFYPTEGDREGKMEEEDEKEGEKYDPFDPTGSPASDVGEGSGKVRCLKRKAERQDDEDKEEPPPDSTDTDSVLPATSLTTQLPLRRRVDCKTTRTREHRESIDSDDSEIEEGEIVGAADRDGSNKKAVEEILPLNSPSTSFFGPKTERILRVLDGDNFVSVRAEGNWEADRDTEDEHEVGVEDLRRKLVNKRKERYLSFPASTPLSPQPLPPPSQPPSCPPSSPVNSSVEQSSKGRKSSKSSKDCDRRKGKDRKAGEREEKRKKRRKEKEGGHERGREKEHGHKIGKEVKGRRSSRSSSRKRKRRQPSSPEVSRSHNSSGKGVHIGSVSEECDKERKRDKDKNKNRDRDRNIDGEREKDGARDKDREKNHISSHRRDESERGSNSRKKDRERGTGQHSSSRERGSSRRSKRSRGKRVGDREREQNRERERRRDGRPVVPPSIQDLNGSDLFAIKRTITVTTTTTTTTVPGSPRLAPTSPVRSMQDSDKPCKRKKRKWHSVGGEEDRGSCCSQSQSLSSPRYRSYESDHYSDKLEIDMLSLDGEALDSDYPSLEDTPPPVLPPKPPIHSIKTKSAPKTERYHSKKKSRSLKKMGQSESSSSSSIRTKSECFSSLTGTSGSAPNSSALPSTKRNRKLGKNKDREKGSRKEAGHSGKSKKESGGSRKGKLQSKVSVLVREGVSSTTGASVGTGKLGMELLGPGGTAGGAGSSVVGGSIAVVFCRDNESRSPFLKPCSEPRSLSSRGKDLASISKCSSLAAPLSSLTSHAGFKSKKAKPSSVTSTSSSASSPSSSLVNKRRRRLGKKTREKGGGAALSDEEGSQSKATSEGWIGDSSEVQSIVEDCSKSLSPHTGQAGPAPCSSSSSSSTSTIALQPCSSPPHTPPPSMGPLRDTRESSPDSQTVDSSCKTPETSFLAEDCPTQTSPALPPSSPVSLSTAQGPSLTVALSTSTVKPLHSDDVPKSLASPPCSSSSVSCGLASISLPPSSSDPSSSSVSSSSASKAPPPPPPPPLTAPALPWSLQTGVDCTTGGVLACELIHW